MVTKKAPAKSTTRSARKRPAAAATVAPRAGSQTTSARKPRATTKQSAKRAATTRARRPRSTAAADDIRITLADDQRSSAPRSRGADTGDDGVIKLTRGALIICILNILVTLFLVFFFGKAVFGDTSGGGGYRNGAHTHYSAGAQSTPRRPSSFALHVDSLPLELPTRYESRMSAMDSMIYLLRASYDDYVRTFSGMADDPAVRLRHTIPLIQFRNALVDLGMALQSRNASAYAARIRTVHAFYDDHVQEHFNTLETWADQDASQ